MSADGQFNRALVAREVYHVYISALLLGSGGQGGAHGPDDTCLRP